MMIDTVSSGIYSIQQAARLINASPKKLRGWVVGHHEKKHGPMIQSEIDVIDHQIALTFVNLIEARFIDAFSKLGVSVRSIRFMAEEAKRQLNHPHPFATDTMFKTDGRTIFIYADDSAGGPKIYDLRKRNMAIYKIVEREIKKEVVYGPSGSAEMWFPRKDIAPAVMLHPKIAFGQPALKDIGVPTETIYETYVAERRNFSSVARWFDIPVNRVKEAVIFEESLIRTLH